MGRSEREPHYSVKPRSTLGWLIILMVIILQWNARSLMANGQEFKHFINELEEKPDVICIQETWLKPNLDFVIHGYIVLKKDRIDGGGCGCDIFFKLGLPYRLIEMGVDQEYIAVEVWERGEGISVINYYNPCKRLLIDNLLIIQGQDRQKVIWCADFYAHSPMCVCVCGGGYKQM